jgi:hypothetical protein
MTKGKNKEGNKVDKKTGSHLSPFERIKRTNDAGGEYWTGREFAAILGYTDYRSKKKSKSRE